MEFTDDGQVEVPKFVLFATFWHLDLAVHQYRDAPTYVHHFCDACTYVTLQIGARMTDRRWTTTDISHFNE
jgi:hypothetical protein